METTLNIHIDVMSKIHKAAKTNRVSCSKMIVFLIKKAMLDIKNPGYMGKLVRYQPRNTGNSWHLFHISYRIDDYEYIQDLRRLLKMSVSLILAYAVDKFLGKEQTQITDNYLPKNYMIIKEIIDSIICWRFIWGFPPNLHELIQPKSP